MRPGRWLTVLAWLVVWGALAGAGAEVRRYQAVGVAPIDPGARARAPRDLALEAALMDVVLRGARELVPDLDPIEDHELLVEVLGDEPQDYISHFRILEDRGRRPALFSERPEIESEYVVVVDARVDLDRVGARLAEAGLFIDRSGGGRRVLLVLEDLQDFRSYALLKKTLIEGVGARAVVPVEFQRGRAVLEVDAGKDPADLLDELLRVAPPQLEIVPLYVESGTLTLQVAVHPDDSEGNRPAARGRGSPARVGSPRRFAPGGGAPE